MPARVTFNFAVILIPLVSYYALSRHHEHAADKVAVEATGQPEIGIRALVNLYRHLEVPTERSKILELFSTHPGLWNRVEEIARLGQVSPDLVSAIRESFSEPTHHCSR
jgi:Zn-dependent protease with chaperone function